MPVQSLLNRQHDNRHYHHHRHCHPSNGGGIVQNENYEGLSNQSNFFLSRKRLLSKRSYLTQSTERETLNGGTKRHKKMGIGRKMGGDGKECIY